MILLIQSQQGSRHVWVDCIPLRGKLQFYKSVKYLAGMDDSVAYRADMKTTSLHVAAYNRNVLMLMSF